MAPRRSASDAGDQGSEQQRHRPGPAFHSELQIAGEARAPQLRRERVQGHEPEAGQEPRAHALPDADLQQGRGPPDLVEPLVNSRMIGQQHAHPLPCLADGISHLAPGIPLKYCAEGRGRTGETARAYIGIVLPEP